MNEWIKKNFNLVLIIFILLGPILDMVTGIILHVFHVNITIGIIFRILFLIFVLYALIFVYKKKKHLYLYGILILYGIFYIVGMLLYKDGVGIFSEIQGLARVFYFPVLLIALYDLRDEIKVTNMILMVILLTYLVCILVPNCLNIGFESYEITKKGSLGFFNSANEISGIISILTPFMFLIFIKIKKVVPIIIISLLYLVVILSIGTKSPLLSLGITVFFIYLYFIYQEVKIKKYKIVFLSLIALLLFIGLLILVLPKTTFYKNIKTHLDFLEVDNITEVVKDKGLIDHFIFSQRLTFLENRKEDYLDASTYEKLFGIGYLEFGQEEKAVEMDYFDIYYSHGVVGFIIYFAIYGYIFYLIMKKREKLNIEKYCIYISIILIILLSFITGHIITAPSVSILVAIILLKVMPDKLRKAVKIKKKEKKGILTIKNMLNEV